MKSGDSVFLGLDIGTTHIKAVAYDVRGEARGIARVSTPAHATHDGGAHYLAAELWTGTVQAVRMCTEQLRDCRIEAVGIASMAESGVLLDASGEPAGPILAWYDPRPGRFLGQVRELVPSLELFRRTGLRPHSKYSLLKLLWMKEHLPDAWKRAASWLHVAEYIAFRFTGVRRTEMSLASRTMLFHIGRISWDEELIREFGIKRELLQPVIPSGAACGTVGREAATQTGIPEGTPVTIAGHDHVVGTFGIGGTNEGDVVNSCGTAETLVVTVPPMEMRLFSEVPDFSVGCHVLPERRYAMLSVGTTGGVVEWFLRLAGWNYDRLLEALSAERGGAPGCGFYPFLYGDAEMVRDIQAAWFGGPVSGMDPGRMALAMIYGLCCQFRHRMRVLEESGIRVGRLLVTGGATRNPVWMQGKADMLNRPLLIVGDSEGVARGAAMLAAKAVRFPDRIPVPPAADVTPDAESNRRLEAYYARYLKNMELLRRISVT